MAKNFAFNDLCHTNLIHYHLKLSKAEKLIFFQTNENENQNNVSFKSFLIKKIFVHDSHK